MIKAEKNSTVIIDEERAPLIRMAFEYYATGDCSVKSLNEYLARQGLTTVATPKVASKPIDAGSLNNVLVGSVKDFAHFGSHLVAGSQPEEVSAIGAEARSEDGSCVRSRHESKGLDGMSLYLRVASPTNNVECCYNERKYLYTKYLNKRNRKGKNDDQIY